MEPDQNDESTGDHYVSEEDKRNVEAIIANRPKSVSTNLTTGEVVTIYKDGRVVKNLIEPTSPIITKIEYGGNGIGKIECKVRLY